MAAIYMIHGKNPLIDLEALGKSIVDLAAEKKEEIHFHGGSFLIQPPAIFLECSEEFFTAVKALPLCGRTDSAKGVQTSRSMHIRDFYAKPSPKKPQP